MFRQRPSFSCSPERLFASLLGLFLCFVVLCAPLRGAEWRDLFPGLEGFQEWISVGDGLWSLTQEGYLLGQRDPRAPAFEAPWFNSWKGKLNRSWLATNFKVVMSQAWLYTRQEFYEYDLQLEWWVPSGGNSGVSLHDVTRGRYTFGEASDLRRTPSQVGYEIQINNGYADEYPSGSIYMIVRARTGAQKDNDWNRFDIEVRRDRIRVRLNGQLVAEHPPLPDRPKAGPIGLQLHDARSLALFRHIRVREVTPLPEASSSASSR